MILLGGGRIAADDRPAAVLTPENLAHLFGVRADVQLDRDGRPFVLPHEPLGAAPRGGSTP
jgi:ABC-type hemin transport system ATPase subunit